MNALILIAAMAGPVYADDCERISDLATRVMESRQYRHYAEFEPRNRMEREMILSVYHWPGYYSDKNRHQAIKQFTADWTKACLSGAYE